MAGRYYTSPFVARQMVAWAGPLDGLAVLEPSAGDGVIVRCMPKTIDSITAVENDPFALKKLEQFNRVSKFALVRGDFLKLKFAAGADADPFAVCIANPPYEDGNDIAHVVKMVEVASRTIVLLRLIVLNLVSFHEKVLTKARIERKAHFLGRPLFGGPDDAGDTARHDYVVLDLRADPSGHKNGSAIPTEFWRARPPRAKP
jgi:phospholipid N-methyltransferase